MDFDSLIQFKALEQAYISSNSSVLDHINSEGLKKLQFDVPPELYTDVEGVCSLLSMTKREFLTAATVAALDRASSLIKGVFPAHIVEGQPC